VFSKGTLGLFVHRLHELTGLPPQGSLPDRLIPSFHIATFIRIVSPLASANVPVKPPGFLVRDQETPKRTAASAFFNFSRLKEDMAAGQGDYLSSLATLMEVPQEDRQDFFT